MNPTAIVAAMAALEEWMARDDNMSRRCEISGPHDERLPWGVTLTVTGEMPADDRLVDVSGKTMADALAQAAQVVVADPLLESSLEEG